MRKEKNIILGIETSCDETSAAVIKVTSCQLSVASFEILSNIVLSQIPIHKKYGGVVPEVAARNHIKNIIPVIQIAFDEAEIKPENIDTIAVTTGPGLITSLMVGVETARTLAMSWKKPIVPVNHIKAHIYAAMLHSNSKHEIRNSKQIQNSKSKILNFGINFPVLALVVSGGHTELIIIERGWKFKKIGQTLDDAAGEAFDKVAKILGLGYPGGPIISKMAENGDAKTFDFPRPMINSTDFNFSFSGLKTAVLYTTYKLKATPRSRARGREISYKLKKDVAASFQEAVVDVLVAKTIRAAQKFKVKTIIMGGGVAANKLLREVMERKAKEFGFHFIVPEIKLCTDNAAPVAVAGYFGKAIPWQKIEAEPGLEVE